MAVAYPKGMPLSKITRPLREILPEHTGIFKLHLSASATLGNDNLREQLQLPWGVSRNAWIAAKTVSTFEHLVFLVNVLEGTCTPESCPIMCCGKHVQYAWADDNHRKPQKLPAIEYMGALVEWGHAKLSDPRLLPQDEGQVNDDRFPADFLSHMKNLHKRMFRVYAHTYTHHFTDVQAKDAEAILNLSFKHWLFFVRLFDLVSEDDVAPLRTLIDKFEGHQDFNEHKHGGRRGPLAPRAQDGRMLLEPSRGGQLGRSADEFE